MHSRFRLRTAAVYIAASFIVCSMPLQAKVSQQDKKDAQQLLTELIPYRTAKGYGQVPEMVDHLEKVLLQAGFKKNEIARTPVTVEGEKVSGLIVRYQSASNSEQPPVAFLAHMDVVDALPKNWNTDPYQPVVKDGYLYGRGSQDNKFGVALLVSTFANLKASGYQPERDLILAFSGDEETGMLTTREILQHRWVKNAEFALNSDAGGGTIKADGTPVAFSMQAAEKTYATFILSVKKAGGHSSAPHPDNAIYELAGALKQLESLDFPVEFNDITRSMAKAVAKREGGELATALETLLVDPADKRAIAVVKKYPQYSNMLWTTCVATMLDAGHAENALPQEAQATVNCRILPDTGGVAHVRQKLKETMSNQELTIKLKGEAVESPASPVRDDIVQILQEGVAINYPDVALQPTMSSGGTEGREYRRAGIPTYGAGSLGLVRPDDSRAHGTDERIPLTSFHKEMDYWDHVIRKIGKGGKQ